MKPTPKRDVIVIAHDMRSAHNVGSLLRTAEGLGVTKVYLTGYTPHPEYEDDPRLPHIAKKLTKDIHKTALGAEVSQAWEYVVDPVGLLSELTEGGYQILGLEQSESSVLLPDINVRAKVALLLGREVEGIDPVLMKQCDQIIEIPMFGKKESFNVVQASAMAMYQLTCL